MEILNFSNMGRAVFWLCLLFVALIEDAAIAQRLPLNNMLFTEPRMLDAPKEVEDWVSFGMRDLDFDGFEDRLFLHNNGLLIEWGQPAGIVPELGERCHYNEEGNALRILMPPNLRKQGTSNNPWDLNGEIEDSGLAQFWIEWGGPKRVIGFVIINREIRKVKEILLEPESAAFATDGGILFGPDKSGKLYLDEFGVTRVLTRNCPPLRQLNFVDLDGDGSRDLILFKRDGSTGVAFGNHGDLKGLHWLERVEGMSHVVLTGHPLGGYALVGSDKLGNKTVTWVFNRGSWEMNDLNVPELFEGATRLHAFPWMDGKWLWISEHFHERSIIGVVVEGLEVLQFFRMDDVEFVGAPQIADFNADGSLDLVYANAKSNQLIVHHGLQSQVNSELLQLSSSHEMMLWKSQRLSSDALEPFVRPYPVECLRELEQSLLDASEIKHLRCEAGTLFARGDSTLIRAQPVHHWKDDHQAFEPDTGGSFLSIQHMRVASEMPSVLHLDEWSHLFFAKEKSGRSTIYINGRKTGSGWVREEVESLRILFLGCSNLGQRGRFFKGAIDEVMIWDRTLDSAEIAAVYEANRVLIDTRPEMYFDFDRDASNPHDWGSHPLAFDNGLGELVDGVHGLAMAFDGQETYASIFTDIPDDELSISIWVKPLGPSAGQHQTFLGIYGDWNLDFDLLSNEEWNRLKEMRTMHLHSEQIPVPAHCFPFRYGKVEYALSEEGLVYIRAGLGWRAIQTNGADPLSESVGLRGTPWLAGGRLNAVFGNCHMWFQFDPRSMTWSTNGRLNPLLKDFDFAIAGLGGTAFIRQQPNPGMWWKPQKENVIYPLAPPVFGEAAVGILADLEGFWWIDDAGELDALSLLPKADAIPFLKPEIPLWMFMAGGASLFLLMGLRYIPDGSLRRTLHLGDDKFNHVEDPELGSALEIHKDLLFRLSEDAGEGVDTNNLDVIFDIHHIETDETRRSRRSRLVKELNEWYVAEQGRLLIRREIDPEDRRRRIYVVDEGLGVYLSREFPANGDQA